jgi:hypothetical protein
MAQTALQLRARPLGETLTSVCSAQETNAFAL